MKKKKLGLWLTVMPLYLFTLVFVVGPLIYMFVLSFCTRGDHYETVMTFTLDNYKKVAEPVYRNTFMESIKLAFTTTIITILLGYPFGYFMAKLSSSKKKIMMALIMVPFWTSSLVRMYGWSILLQSNGILDKILMGIGITQKPLKLLYTYPAVVSGMVYALLPFMMLAVYSSAEKMDWLLVEAARDLGASAWKAFWTVTWKMTLPGMMTGVVLTFVPSMGLFFVADILGGNKVPLVGNVIQEQLTKGRNWPFAAALSVILMIMTSLFIAIYRKVTGAKELEGLM
ncbi:MAG: ABC transporter permease [Clostridiales bacterium]|nr:ABC transporter permease [Clostridiales bacterium]